MSDDETQIQSVEYAMVTRTEYENWKQAYDVMMKMLEMGSISKDQVLEVIALIGGVV